MSKPDLRFIVSKLKELEPQLREQYGVSGLWVFGSYVRGEQGPGSDIDILVEFDRPGMTLFRFVDLEQVLSNALDADVDLVQRSALKPAIQPRVFAEAVAV